MNIVILSPHFPPSMTMFCRRLRELGATVLGLGDTAWEALRPELQAALSDYYRVDDMHDVDALVRALGWFTHRHGRIDRLDSLNEYWLETEAALRQAFDIRGLRPDVIDRVKRKSVMKRVFERAGIAVARGRVCRTPAEARRFVAEVGYPVIAKPDVGVGAASTYRIDRDDELEAFLGAMPAFDFIFEECLSGEIVTFDGLVDRDGRVVMAVTMTYALPVLDVVSGADMTYWIARDIPPDLDALGRAVLAAFEVRERPFHFEFFRQPGRIVALEVNMRQPGGLTVDMWNYGGDIDAYRAWAEIVVTGTARLPAERPYVVLYAGRRSDRGYRLSGAEIAARFGHLVVLHQRIDDVFASNIGNEGWILRAPELEPLRAAAREIQEVA
ncbi:MAG: ATP-dependent carboxylate-amine ligase domain protein ATP-grasp [Chloroflexi bacterium]|nr:ATP-dependent carboxylate-amine ligase domain protein ATP-grasp [Chloroflexota bacterium]